MPDPILPPTKIPQIYRAAVERVIREYAQRAGGCYTLWDEHIPVATITLQQDGVRQSRIWISCHRDASKIYIAFTPDTMGHPTNNNHIPSTRKVSIPRFISLRLRGLKAQDVLRQQMQQVLEQAWLQSSAQVPEFADGSRRNQK